MPTSSFTSEAASAVNSHVRRLFFKGNPTPETQFVEWDLDSFDLASLARALEVELKAKIPNSNFHSWKKFGDVYGWYSDALVASKSSSSSTTATTAAAKSTTTSAATAVNKTTDMSSESVEWPLKNPKEPTVVVFPGQGSQNSKMAEDYMMHPVTKEYFDIANSMLGYDLHKICVEGGSVLDKTDVAQPALLVCSLCALEKLKMRKPDVYNNIAATAGFSLGEFPALVLAGAMSFQDALRVVQVRGSAMQAAAVMYGEKSTGMVSVLGLEEADVQKLIDRTSDAEGELVISNVLNKTVITVAGSTARKNRLMEIAPQMGVKRLFEVPVAGAFHSPYMKPAVEKLEKVLKEVTIHQPKIPVLSNVDGKPYTSPEDIREKLLKQIVSPVQWIKTMQTAVSLGIRTLYEVGPGPVLKNATAKFNIENGNPIPNVYGFK